MPEIIARYRATTSGCDAANAGVNQRPTTASATTSGVPASRTAAARSCQPSAGGRYADVQIRTSRSIRSGALMASHWPTMPPIESPQ